MANEVVRYNNDVQSVALTKLNPVEARVFFALIHKLRDKGQQEVTFSWNELKQLARIRDNRDPERFAKTLRGIFDKVIQLAICIDKPGGWIMFTLFSEFEVSVENQTLRCQVHPRFEYVLNHIDQNFIRFELPEFLKLRGKYAQALFRHLKQYRDTGIWKVSVVDFRRLMSIPKCYRTTNITEQVIEPAVKECLPFFGNTINWHYNKRKGTGGRGRGGSVESITFTFQTQMDIFQSWVDPTLNVNVIHEVKAIGSEQPMIEAVAADPRDTEALEAEKEIPQRPERRPVPPVQWQ